MAEQNNPGMDYEILLSGGTQNLVNTALQRTIELGERRIAPDIDTTREDTARREARLELFSKNEPAFRVELTEDEIEELAEMALEGKSLAIMASVLGVNIPQARLALRDTRVQARIDEIAAEVVKKSSRKIKTSAYKAVEKLINLMENSESDKIVLAAAKDLLKMAGVGEDEKEKEREALDDMQAKSTDKLLSILQNVMGVNNG